MANLHHFIVDYKTFKDVKKPYFTARKVRAGEEIHPRIKQGKIFKESPFGLYSVLKIKECDKEFKKKPINGVWAVTDGLGDVLANYEVVK